MSKCNKLLCYYYTPLPVVLLMLLLECHRHHIHVLLCIARLFVVVCLRNYYCCDIQVTLKKLYVQCFRLLIIIRNVRPSSNSSANNYSKSHAFHTIVLFFLITVLKFILYFPFSKSFQICLYNFLFSEIFPNVGARRSLKGKEKLPFNQ